MTLTIFSAIDGVNFVILMAYFLQNKYTIAVSENGALAVADIWSEKCKIGI